MLPYKYALTGNGSNSYKYEDEYTTMCHSREKKLPAHKLRCMLTLEHVSENINEFTVLTYLLPALYPHQC